MLRDFVRLLVCREFILQNLKQNSQVTYFVLSGYINLYYALILLLMFVLYQLYVLCLVFNSFRICEKPNNEENCVIALMRYLLVLLFMIFMLFIAFNAISYTDFLCNFVFSAFCYLH